ncbi:MAG: chorismate synthase [Bacteroidia bacterium]|nr:chorismate synthase [Bacteroidia bacterium]
MNWFGNQFRLSIFGESHGTSVGIVIDGCPAGLSLQPEDFEADLERRKGNHQKGTTPRKEADIPLIESGIFQGKTTGTPILLRFLNENIRSQDYEQFLTIPRPGHADWTAMVKFGGYQDYRGGGHFSARLTTGLVAAGVIAKKLIPTVNILAQVIEVAGEKNIDIGLQKAIEAKDSVGGIVECRVQGVPAGLGEPYFDSLESLLAHGLFSIPAVRGIEFGTGFAATKLFGSQHNDAIIHTDGTTATNHAGGIVGGISNGNEIVFRLAFKPTASTPKPQTSLNLQTGSLETFSIKGRHDLCVALRAPVIVEAVTAIVLVDCLLMQGLLPRILS